MKILIDMGHGYQTPGKKSVDSKLHEWHFNRVLGTLLYFKLKGLGYDVEEIVKDDDDMPLGDRTNYANSICSKLGKDNVIFISIHANAAGNGTQWTSARGFSVYTSIGQTKSDILANYIYESARKYITGTKIRTERSNDGDDDYESNFWVLRKTLCPAVLIECAFMDNQEDMKYLSSMRGKEELVESITEGIMNYIDKE